MTGNRIPIQSKGGHSLRDYALAIEAWIMLAVARTVIVLLPFRWTMQVLVRPGGGVMSTHTLSRIAQAIGRAAHRAPFRALCFEQALAAHCMIRSRGAASVVHYGLAKNGSALTAHVWLTYGDRILTGAEAAPDFNEVASWPTRQRAR